MVGHHSSTWVASFLFSIFSIFFMSSCFALFIPAISIEGEWLAGQFFFLYFQSQLHHVNRLTRVLSIGKSCCNVILCHRSMNKCCYVHFFVFVLHLFIYIFSFFFSRSICITARSCHLHWKQLCYEQKMVFPLNINFHVFLFVVLNANGKNATTRVEL